MARMLEIAALSLLLLGSSGCAHKASLAAPVGQTSSQGQAALQGSIQSPATAASPELAQFDPDFNQPASVSGGKAVETDHAPSNLAEAGLGTGEAAAPEPAQTAQADHPAALLPTPPPGQPGTPVRPFYELAGTAPTAPGLAMRPRVFGPEPAKVVYLTIDDGPYPETTPRILKILHDEGVPATFFVVGRQVAKHPDLLKAEYEQGHAIGNHTYSHDYSDVYRSPEAFLASIKKNENLIYSIIGRRPLIIRAPGGTQGHFNVHYYNAIDAAGYLVFDWNVSTGDAAAPLVPTDQLVRNAENQSWGKERVIVLMHDIGTKTTTVAALPQIIKYYREHGYSFGVLGPNVAPILFPGGFRA